MILAYNMSQICDIFLDYAISIFMACPLRRTKRPAEGSKLGVPQNEAAMHGPLLGEFMGTMVLVLLRDGVVANVVLKKSKGEGAGWMIPQGFSSQLAVRATRVFEFLSLRG
jgi:hypothetical protein